MAANHVLFIGWNRPVAGKETAAAEHLNQFVNYLNKQQQMGNIDSHEAVLLDHHGGDLNGFVLVRGDYNKLTAMRNTDEWMDINVRGAVLTTHLGEIHGYINEGMRNRISRYTKQATR